jgi:hypothetical protein
MKKTIKKFARNTLRLGIGLGIIVFILTKINLREMLSVLHQSLFQWPWLVLGTLISVVCLLIGTERWKIILDAQGLKMAWSRVFCITLIGQFFNSFMFGSTGGDLARAFYAAKETHHKKTEAVATVVIDRMIGLVMLNLIAAVMLATRYKFYVSHWSTHLPALLMIGMIAATVAALFVVYNIRFFKGWPILRSIEYHPKIGPVVRRMLISIYLYHRRGKVLFKTSLLTLLIHSLIILQCFCFGKSLQINITILDYFTVIPLIISLAAIPITPGGLGVREGLAVTMLGALNVSAHQALPLSLMIYLVSVALSLFGGFIFLGYTAGAGHTVHDEIVDLEDEASDENR